jgi:isovaleryl-CoA dehydrogenase
VSLKSPAQDCDWQAKMNELRLPLAQHSERTDKNAEFPKETVRLLADQKLLGLLIPSRFGGMGASSVAFASVVQSIAESCASTGMIFVMHCCGVETIAKHHSSADQLMQSVVRGQQISSLACSERGTGANFYASFAESKATSDGYLLSGEKCFVTSGNHADCYVVSARAVGSDSATNTSLYIVEKDAPGLSFSGKWDGLGLRGNSSVNMKLNDCRVPKSALIGSQGQGLDIEMGTILPRFLLGSACVYNGIATAALNAAIDHAKSRTHAHTGETLSALPVLRSKIAQMKIQVDSSVSFAKSAASSLDAGKGSALLELLEAKQLACSMAVNVTGMAMETAGGIAFAGMLPIERHFRDAQAGVVMAPTNAMLLDLVGRAALDMPLM